MAKRDGEIAVAEGANPRRDIHAAGRWGRASGPERTARGLAGRAEGVRLDAALRDVLEERLVGGVLADGGLFYARTDGSSVRRWKEGGAPNGVGLSPDEKTVYYADTGQRRVYGFEIASPGVLTVKPSLPDGLVVELPAGNLLDSLAVEAGGKVCVATLLNGGITACDPDGSFEHYPFPDRMTTNIAFGGGDMKDAYLALSSTGKLGKARWPRPGLKLNFAA